jgi:hypothetical protein
MPKNLMNYSLKNCQFAEDASPPEKKEFLLLVGGHFVFLDPNMHSWWSES